MDLREERKDEVIPLPSRCKTTIVGMSREQRCNGPLHGEGWRPLLPPSRGRVRGGVAIVGRERGGCRHFGEREQRE
jgi:hypothetical protein